MIKKEKNKKGICQECRVQCIRFVLVRLCDVIAINSLTFEILIVVYFSLCLECILKCKKKIQIFFQPPFSILLISQPLKILHKYTAPKKT